MKNNENSSIFRVQVLIDFMLFTCLNIIMRNENVRYKAIQSANPNITSGTSQGLKFKAGGLYTNYFLERLKRRKYRENKEKFILLAAAISIFIISGIVVSF